MLSIRPPFRLIQPPEFEPGLNLGSNPLSVPCSQREEDRSVQSALRSNPNPKSRSSDSES